MKTLSTFVITVALIVGLVGCGPTPTRYNLTISSTEGGSVTNPGEGTSTYDEGTVVDLVAEAEEGYEFASWTGNVVTIANVDAASTNITMNGDWTISANFANRPVWESTPIPTGKGRLALGLADLPQEITTRQVKDEFLIGVGTTDKEGCVSPEFLSTLRAAGINYFLPFTSWAVIEPIEGHYWGEPCPSSAFYKRLSESGATLDGHCLLFFYDQPWAIPDFVGGRSFDEQKKMIETFVKTTVAKYPEIQIWDLNEPVAQNSLGWSLDQHYDVFVSASKWIHEARPEAKVMINMIPIPCYWSTFQYEPEQVMEELLARGLEADVIGVELYYFFCLWAEPDQQDENGYPNMEWVKDKIRLFSKYKLPIIFSEVGVPGKMNGRELWNEQADWMEEFFRLCHDEPCVIGATWYFVRDDPFMPYAGLVDDDYSLRPVAERLLKLAAEWNPSIVYQLDGDAFIDLEPGTYDVVVGIYTFRVNITLNQTAVLSNS